MPIQPWLRKVNVSAAFRDDDSMTFEQRRDHVVAKLRKLLPETPDVTDDETMIFRDLVDGLSCVDEEDEFDEWWSDIYDWADRNRVWIETRRPA